MREIFHEPEYFVFTNQYIVISFRKHQEFAELAIVLTEQEQKGGSRVPARPAESRKKKLGAGDKELESQSPLLSLPEKTMLREIHGIANVPGIYRRWFHDDDFDVFLWQTPMGIVIKFQVCYGLGPDERALAWHQLAGLFHDGANGSAITSPAPAFDLARFEEAAFGLPRTVRNVVKRHIREYVEGRLPAPARRRNFRREVWQSTPAHDQSDPGRITA